MPFNGSGTFTVVNTFIPNTTILSAAVNQNFTDIATGLSDCLTRDGQAGMTAAFKAIAGSLGAPSISFTSDATSGLYLSASGVVGLVSHSLGLLLNTTVYSALSATVQAGGAGYSVGDIIIPSGGTAITQPAFQVATLSGTAVATVTVAYPGYITVKATNPVSQGSTSGAGTGCTLNVTYNDQSSSQYAALVTNEAGALPWQRLGASSFMSGLMSSSTAQLARSTLGLLALSAQPPPGSSFKNLQIKTQSTTTCTIVADYVVVTDGTNYQSLAVSVNINFGTTGANALDTGTIASSTWYAMWVIAKPDGTVAGLASTSGTSPTMPSGYTYKARVGWQRTVGGGATLNGIFQFGRRAQYILGTASTTVLPSIVNQSGAIGSVSSPTYVSQSVSSAVPSTASEIFLSIGVISTVGGPTGIVLIAPNGNYGAFNSTSTMPPITSVDNATSNQQFIHGFSSSLLLESTSIYVAWSGGSNLYIGALGWTDNL